MVFLAVRQIRCDSRQSEHTRPNNSAAPKVTMVTRRQSLWSPDELDGAVCWVALTLCSHASRLQNPPSEHLSQKHTQVNNNTAAWLRFCGDEGDRESGSGQFAARSDWHGPQRWGEKMRGNSGSVSAACSTLTLIREIKEVGACSVLWRMMLSKHVLLSVILMLFCSFRLHAKIDLNERVNIWNSSEVSDLSCHVKKLKSWSVTKIKPNTQSVFIYTHYLTLCSLSEIK